MIKIVLHELEVFTTPVGILVDTLVVEKSKPKLNPSVESIIEYILVDLVIGVKQIDLDVWFWGRNLVFKRGVVLTQFFTYCNNNQFSLMSNQWYITILKNY